MMKKVLMLSLYVLVILGCVFSTTFEMYQPVDDFGDPVGEKIIKSKALNGTYKTASVQDGKISYTISIQNDGVIQTRIVEAGNTGDLLGAVYTSDTLSVIIRPDSGPDVTTTAVIKQGDDKKYNVLQFSGSSALAAFTDHNSIRIVIKNDRVTYSLGAVDTSEVEGLYYKALNNQIDSLLASKNYEEVIRLVNAEGDTEKAAYYGLSKKLLQAKMALGIFEIGDRGPAGGWIFYDCDEDNSTGNADGLISTECGWRYLEVAPSDIGEYVFGYYRPDGTNNNVVGTAQAIGSGRYNTERLVEYMDIDGKAYSNYSGEATYSEYAAKKCLDYTDGVYDDWFLPSKDELDLMYQNLHKKGLGSFVYAYWASSEDRSKDAWRQDFFSGYQSSGSRFSYSYVRPVRAF